MAAEAGATAGRTRTDGDGPGGYRQAATLAWPVILSNTSIPLLGAVDTAVMGHLPDPAYIGGVALGALIFNYLYWSFGFLRMSTTGLVAQATGAGDADGVRVVLARAWLLVALLGLGLLALQGPLERLAFAILDGADQVEDMAAAYYRVRIWGAPGALLHYVTLGWLFGTRRMRTALFLVVAMNGVNIGLDLLFVVGMGMGTEGVALATVIAEWGSAIPGLLIVLHGAGRGWSLARTAEPGGLAGMVRINADIFLRSILLITAFAWLTAESASMGTTILAANAVLMNFQLLVGYALDGFAHAAEALVGRAAGARDRTALLRAIRTTTVLAAGTAILFAGFFLVAGDAIIGLMTTLPGVRETAGRYLPWLVVSPLLSVWSFQLDGIFIGATRSAAMRNAMIASFAVWVAGVMLLVPWLGNHGLWLAFALFMVARAVTLAAGLPGLTRVGGATPTAPAETGG